MRLFEILLFVFNIIVTVSIVTGFFKKIKWIRYIPLITFAIFVIHFFIEKTRWSLYPLYLVTIIYFITSLLNMTSILQYKHSKARSILKKIGIGFMIIFMIVSGALAYVFPVYDMPTPPGEYEIGTQSFDITDPVRNAIYSDDLDNMRKIKIQIWYPAESTQGYTKVPWMEDGLILAEAMSKYMNLPFFTLSQTALVESNSYENAPISNQLDQYPVVVISHGWSGFRAVHADVAEQLASEGYIVIGIDHTYGSIATVFNDGEVAYLNADALPDSSITPNFLEYANTLVTTYAGDVTLTIDELEKMNDGEIESDFLGELDLSEIGLLGHSTGGGGIVTVALEDNRIKALIGMDAWVEPIDQQEIEKGLNIPALFLRSEQWEVGANNENLYNLIDHSLDSTELYQINGMMHSDFSMIYMYSPILKYLNLAGELDGRISSKIQKDFIQNFFDENLKGDSSMNMDEVANNWTEVDKIK